ncbi:MAG: MotE family protein [Rickettsiaceae bacterium]
MKTNILPIMLITLVSLLFIKAIFIFNSIEEHNQYNDHSSVNSTFVGTAYAKDDRDLVMQPTNQGNKANDQNLIQGQSVENAKDNSANVSNQNINQIINKEISDLTPGELKLLQSLAERNKKLDQKQEDIKLQEQLLDVTKSKIEGKIQALEAEQKRLQNTMANYDKQEHQKIMRLVKIYENMKPKDAAKIFDELEITTLIELVRNMKEMKVAPIIASMNVEKARDLSSYLAKAQ